MTNTIDGAAPYKMDCGGPKTKQKRSKQLSDEAVEQLVEPLPARLSGSSWNFGGDPMRLTVRR